MSPEIPILTEPPIPKSDVPAKKSPVKKVYPRVPITYEAWKQNPTPENLSAILKEVDPLIQSELSKYRGVLPEAALKGQAKRHAIEAIRGYDPSKGAKLTTHMVNTLQKLYRENYKHQQALRLSEELQRGVGTFNRVRDDLTHRLRREPTAAELADELSWPISKIERIQRQARGEVFGSDLEFDPVDVEYSDSDPRLDYVYFDLSPKDKIIFEHVTGYSGAVRMSKKDIAKKLGISQAAVTQRSKRFGKQLADVMGWRI